MFEAVTSSPFFGLALTLGCWCLGVELQRRTGLLICNPVLVASLLVIGALTVLRVPLECYNAGGGLVKLMLGPATAVLALNIYQQRQVLREHFLPVLAGCLAGSAASMGSVLLLCRLFRAEEMLAASMLPKSVTTAIALGISESGGGIPGITAAAVVITGVEGAMLAPLFARCFRITDPVAEGVAIGRQQPRRGYLQGPGDRPPPGGHEFHRHLRVWDLHLSAGAVLLKKAAELDTERIDKKAQKAAGIAGGLLLFICLEISPVRYSPGRHSR